MKNTKSFQKVNNRRIGEKRTIDRLFPYLLLAPVVIYILCILVWPLGYGIWISFTKKTIGLAPRFNGIKNYIALFQKKDFLRTVQNTFLYTFATVSLKTVLGVIMALVLNAKIRFRSLARGFLLIPWAIPTVVTVLTWKWMYSDVGGVLNALFMKLGLTSEKIAWLSTANMAFLSVVIVNVWRGTPFIGISVLSGLQSVPLDMYEAAELDGINKWQGFWYITLPSIKDVLMLSILVTTIWTFSDFEIIWLMTKGGPVNATQLVSTYSYQLGVIQMNSGQSMAASVLFMPLMILLVNLVTRRTLGKEDN